MVVMELREGVLGFLVVCTDDRVGGIGGCTCKPTPMDLVISRFAKEGDFLFPDLRKGGWL